MPKTRHINPPNFNCIYIHLYIQYNTTVYIVPFQNLEVHLTNLFTTEHRTSMAQSKVG